MSRLFIGLGVFGLTVGLLSLRETEGGAGATPAPRRVERAIKGAPIPNDARHIVLIQKKKTKKAMPKQDAPDDAAPKPAATSDAKDDGTLKFSRDIAPILVDNCFRCHTGAEPKGGLDMSTFEKLMKGADKEKVIEPGNPDDSHMVKHLRGTEKPKMPPRQNQRRFTENAIEKIEEWIKGGAVLDAGLDPKKPIKSYALTEEDLQAAEFKKMTSEQRDDHVKTVGLERWKKASKDTPEVTVGKNVLLFSTLPKARADATVKVMDTMFSKVKSVVGNSGPSTILKTSLFVFKDRNGFVEFVRAMENREIETEDQFASSFSSAEPYVGVADPLLGQDEPVASKKTRTKKADDGPMTERTLTGLLAEAMTYGMVSKTGKAPKWLSTGLGAYFASTVERGSPYIGKLRRIAYDFADQGWRTKAMEAMGDQAKAEEVRAVGYAICDWIATSSPGLLPRFTQGMMAGGEKLDDVIADVFNGGKRDEFLDYSGLHAASFGGRRR